MPTACALTWKTFSKVRTLWHCSRLRSVALYLWRSCRYPSGTDQMQQYLGQCRALVMVKWSIRLTAWLQNSAAGRNGQELMYEQSRPRLSPLWLSASSFACHGLLIIKCDNAITYKAQRDKNARELKLANGNYWHADASAWCRCSG